MLNLDSDAKSNPSTGPQWAVVAWAWGIVPPDGTARGVLLAVSDGLRLVAEGWGADAGDVFYGREPTTKVNGVYRWEGDGSVYGPDLDGDYDYVLTGKWTLVAEYSTAESDR